MYIGTASSQRSARGVMTCTRAHALAHTHTHARTHAHTRAQTHTHARTHARTHTHTHAHTHTHNASNNLHEVTVCGLLDFLPLPFFSMLLYNYILFKVKSVLVSAEICVVFVSKTGPAHGVQL